MAGRSAIDNQRNAIADLVEDAARVGTLGGSLQVGRGRRDGQPEALHHGARNGRIRHAKGHVAGIGRGAQGQLAAGPDDDGERAGPEALRQLSSMGSVSRASS